MIHLKKKILPRIFLSRSEMRFRVFKLALALYFFTKMKSISSPTPPSYRLFLKFSFLQVFLIVFTQNGCFPFQLSPSFMEFKLTRPTPQISDNHSVGSFSDDMFFNVVSSLCFLEKNANTNLMFR